jgi:hypothetical protein
MELDGDWVGAGTVINMKRKVTAGRSGDQILDQFAWSQSKCESELQFEFDFVTESLQLTHDVSEHQFGTDNETGTATGIGTEVIYEKSHNRSM